MCYIHRAARFQPTWFETFVGNITSSCTNQGSIKEQWIEIASHKNCLIYDNSANVFREFIRLDINRLKQISRTCVINTGKTRQQCGYYSIKRVANLHQEVEFSFSANHSVGAGSRDEDCEAIQIYIQ
jgi:hypothetical protein